jgi:16S rRNA (uracil1498-N3)-methyltransferase
MQLFYQTNMEGGYFECNKDNAHYLCNVLRFKENQHVNFTDGQGKLVEGQIATIAKNKCGIQINQVYFFDKFPSPSIAIAFTKNAARMEWFLEKATEIGVEQIFPLLTHRSERTHFKLERWQNILISAMCQSKQVFLPELHEPITLTDLLENEKRLGFLIAHCMDGEKQSIIKNKDITKASLILIGPEGDFTEEELSLCLQANAQPVSLGSTRLRTETAGIVALTLLNQK